MTPGGPMLKSIHQAEARPVGYFELNGERFFVRGGEVTWASGAGWCATATDAKHFSTKWNGRGVWANPAVLATPAFFADAKAAEGN